MNQEKEMTCRLKRKVVWFTVCVLLSTLSVWANGLTIQPTDPDGQITSGEDYTYLDGVLTLTTLTPVTISSGGVRTSDIIVVSDTRGTMIVTLDNVDISTSGCVFSITSGTAVSLNLAGNNTLISGGYNAGIHVPDGAELMIVGNGNLSATGGNDSNRGGAAIGGNHSNQNFGKITLSGKGTLDLTAGGRSAGIGGGGAINGKQQLTGTITINSGIINAKGHNWAAGIGCGADSYSDGMAIIINGGIITATVGDNGTGIGGGNYTYTGSIAINGGTVRATGKKRDGIGGKDDNKPVGSLTFGGNAFVISNGITDKSSEEAWKGIIYKDIYSGYVCGNDFTLTTDAENPSTAYLFVSNDQSLTIDKDIVLINEGNIVLQGTLNVNGTLKLTKMLLNYGEVTRGTGGKILIGKEEANGVLVSFHKNAGTDSVTNMPYALILEEGTVVEKLPRDPGLTDFSFGGWAVSSSSKTPFDWSTAIDADKLLYAIWKYNNPQVTLSNTVMTYGSVTDPTAVATGYGGAKLNGTITFEYFTDQACTIKTNGSNSGAVTNGGLPRNAGNYYVEATYPEDDDNKQATAQAAFTVNKKELLVAPDAGQTIYQDEFPAYKVSGAVGNEQPAFTGHLGVAGGYVTVGNLQFEEDGVSVNYTWKLPDAPVAISVNELTLAEVYDREAQRLADELGDGWRNEPVILQPSEAFKIRDIHSGEAWASSVTIGQDYQSDFQYRLIRDGKQVSFTYTLPVQLDMTKPDVKVSVSYQTVTIRLSDELSGLLSCRYEWNGGDPTDLTLKEGAREHTFLIRDLTGRYPLKLTVQDRAGNSTVYEKEIVLSDVPVILHTVTLPGIEGVITDPVPGDHEVVSDSSFAFSLMLQDEYDQSEPVVTVDYRILLPRESDGKYVINAVRKDMLIEIDGVVRNLPTANDKLENNPNRIYVSGNTVYIETPVVVKAQIVSAEGRILCQVQLSPGMNDITGLNTGVYFIRLQDYRAVKVLVGKGY